jgi:hypothetical protein
VVVYSPYENFLVNLKLQVFPRPLVQLVVFLIAFHVVVDGAPTFGGAIVSVQQVSFLALCFFGAGCSSSLSQALVHSGSLYAHNSE